MGKHCHWSEKT